MIKKMDVSSDEIKHDLHEVSTSRQSGVSKMSVSDSCSDVTPFSVCDGTIDKIYQL